MLRKLVAVLILGLATPASAASAGPRILYASDWIGPTEIFAVAPSGGLPLGQLTSGSEAGCFPTILACGFADPLPSPDGRFVLYRATGFSVGPPSLWVARGDGNATRVVARGQTGVSGSFVGAAAWSHDSARIAYVTEDGVHVVRRDGGGSRIVSAQIPFSLSWSPDDKALAFLVQSASQDTLPPSDRLFVLRGKRTRLFATVAGERVRWSPDGRWFAISPNRATGAITLIPASGKGKPRQIGRGTWAEWSPNGRYLASESDEGIRLVDVKSGRDRLLTSDNAYPDRNYDPQPLDFAWAPDGRSIAYVTTKVRYDLLGPGDLKTVTLSGRTRTIVPAAGEFGGRIVSVAWTRPSKTVRYRRPARMGPLSVLADGPVLNLAADGSRVAYSTTCLRVTVWTPATGQRATFKGDTWVPDDPICDWADRKDVFTLALAGDRLLYGYNDGGLGSRWWMQQIVLNDNRSARLDIGFGALGGPWQHALGTAVGSGSLLAYSSWDEVSTGPPTYGFRTTSQTVNRVEPGGCPCAALATSPGPLVPFDLEGGRIVASGNNATLVLDADGSELLSIPTPALGAQLDGSHLILLLQGQLRDFDVSSGSMLHAWPLPDVASGSECANPHYCDRRRPRLLLEDARRGLVTYILDGRVHLLRVADGANVDVAAGTLARFSNDGLVYADGARLLVDSWGSLPLLSF